MPSIFNEITSDNKHLTSEDVNLDLGDGNTPHIVTVNVIIVRVNPEYEYKQSILKNMLQV